MAALTVCRGMLLGGLTLLLVGGCASPGPLSAAVAPTSFGSQPHPPFRSEEPVSLVAVQPLLEVTLLADVGVPALVIAYPDPMPGADHQDLDRRTVLVLLGAGEPMERGDGAALLRGVRQLTRRGGSAGVEPLEVDGLLLLQTTGPGLEAALTFLGDPQATVHQVAHTGLAPRRVDGELSVGEAVVVDPGDGTQRHMVASGDLLSSGVRDVERYVRHADPGPQESLMQLLAGALRASPRPRLERLFKGKPNLQSTLPTFPPPGPICDVVSPPRDPRHHGDPHLTDRAASLVLDLRYGAFRMLLVGDLAREGQEELASLSPDWDSTCLLVPTAPQLQVSRRWADHLEAQVGLGLGGGGGHRYPPALLARRLRPGTLFLTEQLPERHHLQVRTDGVLFQVVGINPRDGSRRELTPWRRCLEPAELMGLRATVP